MAVRHGYGKVAGTDALVFAYDTGDTRNSYRGEPTTNLYGDIDTSSSIRGARTEYNTSNWTASFPAPPEKVGRVYKHESGALSSTWSGNSYGYTLKAYTYSANTTYTLSCWVYVSTDCNIDGLPMSIEGGMNWIGGNYSYDLNNKGTWQQLTLNVTQTSQINGNAIPVYPRKDGVTDGTFTGFYAWGGAKLEAINHVTPYTVGTRSSIQGLVDLTGNRTIELANVSFNSSAQPEFDGSNDLITFGGSANIVNKSYTVEAVFNRYSTNRVDGIIGDAQYHWFSFYVTSNNELYFFHRRNSPYTDNGAISATGVVGTGYYHAVGVFDINSGMRVYLNGNLVAGNSNTTAFDLSGRGPQFIGQHRGGAPSSPAVMSGQIPVLKIYEGKALTADEVRNNYNLYKTRFGI